MKTFTDMKGRTWSLHLTTGIARRDFAAAGLNLLDLQVAAEQINATFMNPARALDFLWILCKSQAEEVRELVEIAEEKGWELEDAFLDGLDADQTRNALDLLKEEVLFFIQTISPEHKELVEMVLRKNQKLMNLQIEKLKALIHGGGEPGFDGGGGDGSTSEHRDDETGGSLEEVVFRVGGYLGVDPNNLSLRELDWMANGKRDEDWVKVSWLLAKIHNSFVTKKRHIKMPREFNPMLSEEDETEFVPADANRVKQARDFVVGR